MRIKCLLTLLLSLCLWTPASAEKVTIKLATMAPEGSVFHNTLKDMGQAWKILSDGKVELVIYAGGIGGDDRKVISNIAGGRIQAGMITNAGLASISRAANVFQIPVAYRNAAELDYVISKMGDAVAKKYEDEGYVILSWGEAGWIKFFSKTPLIGPEKRAEHKMFIFDGDPQQAALWEAAGFNVVPLSASEITTGLQTGLITAVPATAQTAMLFQWYQNAPHMLSYSWAPLMGAIVVKKDVWHKIDPGLRHLLKETAKTAGAEMVKVSRPGETQAIADMSNRGLKVHEPSDEQLKAWFAINTSMTEKLKGVYVPADLYDEALKHLEEYRAQNAK